jgi:hypothetical protein
MPGRSIIHSAQWPCSEVPGGAVSWTLRETAVLKFVSVTIPCPTPLTGVSLQDVTGIPAVDADPGDGPPIAIASRRRGDRGHGPRTDDAIEGGAVEQYPAAPIIAAEIGACKRTWPRAGSVLLLRPRVQNRLHETEFAGERAFPDCRRLGRGGRVGPQARRSPYSGSRRGRRRRPGAGIRPDYMSLLRCAERLSNRRRWISG